MDTAQIVIVGILGGMTLIYAAYMIGYYHGERASADSYRKIRDFYNQSKSPTR